ncbi:MAG TPA: hypothetical protein VM328_04625 [Fimbriimonadaceae bacterium]|nr:hypothetical protein [Fimbriimonadaceae bacterium]
MKRCFFTLALSLLAFGCRSSAPEPRTSAPAPEAGWTDHRAGSVSISLPNEWTMIDLTRDDIERILAEVTQKEPQMANLMQMVKMAGDRVQFKLVAMAPKAEGAPGASNVNVVQEKLPGSASLEEVAAPTLQLLKQTQPGKEILSSEVAIAAGPAMRFEYDTPAAAPGAARTITYLLVRGEAAYSVTFTVLSGETIPVDKMINSFRIH